MTAAGFEVPNPVPKPIDSNPPPFHQRPPVPSMAMTSISVLILTLNEEVNLPECLDSCSWCDDIIVFDSFSGDRTPDIAAAKGARFIQRRFDNYAAQRNAALTEVQFKHPWLLMVDAD